MKIAFNYLFRRLRRLLEIPPGLAGGEPDWRITINLRNK